MKYRFRRRHHLTVNVFDVARVFGWRTKARSSLYAYVWLAAQRTVIKSVQPIRIDNPATLGLNGLILIAADATEREHCEWWFGLFSREPGGVRALTENCRLFARDRPGCICPSRISVRLPT